jgi:hypothetical protein
VGDPIVSYIKNKQTKRSEKTEVNEDGGFMLKGGIRKYILNRQLSSRLALVVFEVSWTQIVRR